MILFARLMSHWLRKNLPWASFDNTSFESMDDVAVIVVCRAVFLSPRGVRVHMSVRCGCPQGSVLSPLLWNMVADSLLNWLENCNCFVQGFADDVVILSSGKFLSTICELMQRALNCVQIVLWCGKIGRNVNSDKTSTMVLVSKRRTLVGFFASKLFDTELILNNQVKYLGVILDSKLN
jgi:hypothetical protein